MLPYLILISAISLFIIEYIIEYIIVIITSEGI